MSRFFLVNRFIQQPISSFSRNGPDGSQDGSLFFDLDHTKRFAALYRIAWNPWGLSTFCRWWEVGLSEMDGVFWIQIHGTQNHWDSTGATYKNHQKPISFWGFVTGSYKIRVLKKSKTLHRWCWHLAHGNPKDWAATLNRFFTKTHREVATYDIDVVWSWLQACELMMEEIQILWLFQRPEKLWVESFETDTVFKQNTSQMGRFISRSEKMRHMRV